jgi:hypothetical protein
MAGDGGRGDAGSPIPVSTRSGSRWILGAAALASVATFLALTLPTVPRGAVVGTGQDEWYNMIRGLRALYERLDPAYFIHPALYYELLAVVYGVQRAWLWTSGHSTGGHLGYFLAHESDFLALARYASVACGALAVAASAWLGATLSGPAGAVLAGLVVASLPLLRTTSTYIRVDALALAALIAATALIVRHHRLGDRRSLVVAAIGIGVATAANYPGALLLLPLGWLEWVRAGRSNTGERRRAVAIACVVAFAAFLALNPYVLIDLPQFLRWFAFQARVAVATHPHAEEPSPWRYLLVLRDQGIPAAAACAIGAAAIAAPRSAFGAIGWLGVLYLAVFSAMRSQYDRFALPPIALLAASGAALVPHLFGRIGGARVAAASTAAAALMLLWSAAAQRRELQDAPPPEPSAAVNFDYRAEMLGWIEENVPRNATFLFESDTLPLLQMAYDPGDDPGPFSALLRAAFERVHPRLPGRILKTQFIAAVYNYDPKLLDDAPVYFLASSQNRRYIAENRAALPEPAAFYDALDARGATIVHQSSGYHELLQLYAVGAR